MKPYGDRRSGNRVEAVSVLWGVLEISSRARVVNVGRGGVLVEARAPAEVDSTRVLMRLANDGRPLHIEARVRHLSRGPGPGWPTYGIGFQFIDAPGASDFLQE